MRVPQEVQHSNSTHPGTSSCSRSGGQPRKGYTESCTPEVDDMLPDCFTERLAALNPEAILFEPRETYDKAIVDIVQGPKDHWGRVQVTWVAVYDYDLLIECTMAMLEVDTDDDEAEAIESAQEWVDFNIVGLWAGEGTPLIRSCSADDDDDAEDEDDEPEDGDALWGDEPDEDDDDRYAN